MENLVGDPMEVVIHTTEDREVATELPIETSSELGPQGMLLSAANENVLLSRLSKSSSRTTSSQNDQVVVANYKAAEGLSTNPDDSDDSEDDADSEDSHYLRRPGDFALIPVIPREPKYPALPYSTSRTGLVYDRRMGLHSSLDVDEFHPECPQRIYAIARGLRAANLLADDDSSGYFESEFHEL